MTLVEQGSKVFSGLSGLGGRRLAALALVGLATFALVGIGAAWLGRSSDEVLYTGLERADVGRIGAALTEAGIPFDVNSAGDTVTVPAGQAGPARMLLAEKGLPDSTGAGYELFDDLGSLGLTSFMQEVTRIRALEGEIARTVQLMKGVRAARVHLVLPEEGSFRRDRQPPSASVVLRTEMGHDFDSAAAIRHLVAAAVPGMTLDRVTVLDTDGTLLAGGDGDMAAPASMIGLEQTISSEIRENVKRTLSPYLGRENFRVSVFARLNTDRKQINEVIFDPDSRVERSTRIVRENEKSENIESDTATTVEQNLPEEEVPSEGGDRSEAASDRREELTNYELSSRTIQTVSDGYAIERLSIALLIDREQLQAAEEGEEAEDLGEQIDQIQRLVASAAGFDEERGDTIEVSAVDFLADDGEMQPVEPSPVMELLMRHSGTAINAVTLLGLALLVLWFGFRPAAKTLLEQPTLEASAQPGLPEPEETEDETAVVARKEREDVPDLIGDVTDKLRRSPQKRLEQMVEFDEERVVAILRQWLHKDKTEAVS